jgi:hypothetical protein
VLGVFSVNVQSLGLARKVKDDAIEHSAQVWRGNGDPLCKRHCTQRVPWKQRSEKVECCVGLLCTNGRNPTLYTIRVFKTERRGDQTTSIGRFVHDFSRADRWWRWADVKTRRRIGGTLFRRWSWRILDERRAIGRGMGGRKGGLAGRWRMNNRRRTVCHPVRRPSVWRAFLSRDVKTATRGSNVRSPAFESREDSNFTSGPPEKVVE